MSFNGDLEHFPLVDVIQLLHMTNKTGILYLKCPRGESQLVFHNGFFVSANHLNNSVRIGTVLVDMNAITQEQLNQALLEQKDAGNGRKPLIATLIEQGTIDKETAFTGLETLIEMTIVEVMTYEGMRLPATRMRKGLIIIRLPLLRVEPWRETLVVNWSRNRGGGSAAGIISRKFRKRSKRGNLKIKRNDMKKPVMPERFYPASTGLMKSIDKVAEGVRGCVSGWLRGC